MESNTLSLSDLDKRRRELGMSCALLSQRSGVSRPTVQRILSGRQVAASVENVAAIAAALGLALRFDVSVEPMTFKRQQAERKARRLVGFVQGTSGLEGQAVDDQAVKEMIEQTTHELLVGPKRRLWSEE
jgi:transcriptional regulator with XRE-family HTH domain